MHGERPHSLGFTLGELPETVGGRTPEQQVMAVQTLAQMRHNERQGDVAGGKQLQLLQTADGRRADDGIRVLLDNIAAGQTSLTGGIHGGRGVLELGAKGSQQRTETLGEALVHLY